MLFAVVAVEHVLLFELHLSFVNMLLRDSSSINPLMVLFLLDPCDDTEALQLFEFGPRFEDVELFDDIGCACGC